MEQVVQEQQTVKQKKQKRRLWTEKEDLIVANAVARTNGTNLNAMFKKVAKQLKRSPSAVSTRYYEYIKNKKVLFTNVSAYGVTKPNCKNCKPTKARRHPEHKSFWKKLVSLFKDEFAPKKKRKYQRKKK